MSKIIVQQQKRDDRMPNRPPFIQRGYDPAEHAGEMFTADFGYEIVAVYVTTDP